jgi:hypothetical protein
MIETLDKIPEPETHPVFLFFFFKGPVRHQQSDQSQDDENGKQSYQKWLIP